MAEQVGTVASLWRYPVKSMLGEQLDAVEITSGGIVGDRAYALVDLETDQIVSAKHPRKWGALLGYRAEYVEPPAAGGPLPPVRITFPDGTAVRSDDDGIDATLSDAVGRTVELRSAAPAAKSFEEVWPAIDGLAPRELIDATRVDDDLGETDSTTSRLPLGLDAPAESFFDLARLHLLTTATLDQLGALYPEGAFDVRRYRPNVLVETEASGFVENDWPGAVIELGSDARASVTIPTMRCIMTTLDQQGLPRDPKLLQTVAEHNRLEIDGLGTWACAGVYAGVDRAGTVRIGDPVSR